jgi:hypothetical protein
MKRKLISGEFQESPFNRIHVYVFVCVMDIYIISSTFAFFFFFPFIYNNLPSQSLFVSDIITILSLCKSGIIQWPSLCLT